MQSSNQSSPPQSPLPTAGFTVKTKDEQGYKVFLNICSSPLAPLPSTWPHNAVAAGTLPPEILDFLITGEVSNDAAQRLGQTLAIPIHLSSRRSDIDHEGHPCIVLDCVVNPEAMHTCTFSRPFKNFLANLAMGEAEKALGTQLDPMFKLPKMKSKGPLAPLNLLDRSQNAPSTFLDGGEDVVMEEESVPDLILPGSGGKKDGNGAVIIEKLPKASAAVPIPIQTIDSSTTNQSDNLLGNGTLTYKLKYEGLAHSAIISVPIPPALLTAGLADNLNNMMKIKFQVDNVEINVYKCQALHIQLPLAVEGKSASAVLSKETGILTLRLPLVRFKQVNWKKRSTVEGTATNDAAAVH